MNYTSYALDNNGAGAAGGDITTTSRAYTLDDLVTIEVTFDNDTGANNLTIANSATAQTWNLIADTGVHASTPRVAGWQCRMSAGQTMTITVSGDSATSFVAHAAVKVHTGADPTDPVPAGNVFSGINAHNASQAMTPNGTGSCIWMMCGSWDNGETWGAAANCTVDQSFAGGGGATALIRPTTQPRPDAASFTIGETDISTGIAWIAYEVLADQGPPPPPAPPITAHQSIAFPRRP